MSLARPFTAEVSLRSTSFLSDFYIPNLSVSVINILTVPALNLRKMKFNGHYAALPTFEFAKTAAAPGTRRRVVKSIIKYKTKDFGVVISEKKNVWKL